MYSSLPDTVTPVMEHTLQMSTLAAQEKIFCEMADHI
jgi:hypothetical protein